MEIEKGVNSIPLPVTAAYEIPGVSAGQPQCVRDEQLRRIARSSKHQVYRFSMWVQGTNRAAMAEYLVIMRPSEGTPPNTAYEYIERTSVVRNQDHWIDVNTPVLFFDSASNHLMVHFASFIEVPGLEQTVLVNVTKLWRT